MFDCRYEQLTFLACFHPLLNSIVHSRKPYHRPHSALHRRSSKVGFSVPKLECLVPKIERKDDLRASEYCASICQREFIPDMAIMGYYFGQFPFLPLANVICKCRQTLPGMSLSLF